MGVFKSDTFKSFFSSKFLAERAYMKFNPHHFKHVYHEMARPGVGDNMGDVIKQPISIDKEDIAFLNQFPPKFWRAAFHQRYQMLHDSLMQLHKKRMDMGVKELENKIKNAMMAGWQGDSSGWDNLEGLMSPDVLNRLRHTFNPQYINSFGKNNEEITRAIKDEANKEAFEEIKSKTDGIEESPDPIEFKFTNKSYYAKPYLNRLYHKLERTEGEEHHPSAGLQDFGITHGQYGYDFAFPKKSEIEGKEKRSARGVGSWPSTHTVNAAVNDLWNLNQHHVFGDLKIPDGAIWKKVVGENGKPFKDYHLWNQVEEKYYKRFESQLAKDITQNFGTTSDRTKEARRLAHEATLKDAEEGKLKSPPVPGIDEESRKVRVVGGKVQLPDVYLPHIKTKVKTKNDAGQIVDVDDWVPVMNPVHFFRELGKEETDYKHDEQGKRTGEYDLDALKDRMTGHPDSSGVKPYVRVDPKEYKKSGDMGHQAAASFHLNQNSKGRYFISRGDPKYAEAYQKVFGDMDLRRDASGAELYKDFRAGIVRCAGGNRCGGAGSTERLAILQNIGGIHNIIVAHAMNNLGNPKLHDERGRAAFAEEYTGQFAQTNLGDGPRRKRILDRRLKDVSRDSTAAGSEGGNVSISDTLDSQQRDKHDFAPSAARGRGGRLIAPSDWLDAGNTSYNGEALRQIISKMEDEAKHVDDKKITPDDIDELKNNILDRANVIEAIKNHLVRLYQSAMPDRQNIEKDVEDEIKDWINDGAKNSEQLVSKFETHPLVTKFTGGPNNQDQDQSQEPQPTSVTDAGSQKDRRPPSPDAQDAIEQLKGSAAFQSMKRLQGSETWVQGVKILIPKPGEKYSAFINNFASQIDIDPAHEEETLESLQDFINDEFDLNTPNKTLDTTSTTASPTHASQPQSAMAAREIETRPPGAIRNPNSSNEHFHTLRDQKRWLDFIHHPDFEEIYSKNNPNLNTLSQLKALISSWKNKNYISQIDHDTSQAKLDAAISTAQAKINASRTN